MQPEEKGGLFAMLWPFGQYHVRANAEGLGFGFVLTGAEAHDTGYQALMAQSGPDPKVLLGDRGYNAAPMRADVEARGGTPVIPTNRSRKVPIATDGFIYALRNRIEWASTASRTPGASQPATTRPRPAPSGLLQLTAVRLGLRHFPITP
jgi:hypothetical protein